MNIKSVALVFGATMVLAAGGIGAAACSSSSGGGSGSGSGSSGSSSGGGGDGTTSSSSGSGSGSSSGSTGDDGGSEGGNTTCDSSIPMLYKNAPGELYCFKGADGGTLDCVADSGTGWCCYGGALGGGQYAPQMCGAGPTDCTNGGSPDAGGSAAIPIQCSQIADCAQNGAPGATACCIQGATQPATVSGCGYPKSTHGNAVVCEGDGGGTTATACAAGEVQICSSQADCPSGTTCTAGKWKTFNIGFCQ